MRTDELSYLQKPSRGFVLGKFMPPHAGHVYLGDFASRYVDELTILVCSLPSDPIPGALRVEWMRDMFPKARVQHCSEILPQTPEDDPSNFWTIWRSVVARYHPETIDVVFASDPYGLRLAKEVGAAFVPVDPGRSTFPISASEIRSDPMRNWDFIPGPVRRHFLKRVTLFGAESSGKSTLAKDLAHHFETVAVPEFGRIHTETFGPDATSREDIRKIVLGHLASVEAAKPRANRLLIEDTDPVLTAIWSDTLTGGRDPWFETFRNYPDLYLFCDIDIPWVDDGTRYFSDPDDRRRFHEACARELIKREAPFVRISGTREERLRAAIAAVEPLLS